MNTSKGRFAGYIAWTWLELLAHDLLMKTRGFRSAYARLERTPIRERRVEDGRDRVLLDAIDWTIPFYPKNVMCLQRSFVTARIFRKCGIAANVVIGYRAAPFFSHAWIEVGDRVINDQPAYRRQLTILLRSTGLSADASGSSS